VEKKTVRAGFMSVIFMFGSSVALSVEASSVHMDSVSLLDHIQAKSDGHAHGYTKGKAKSLLLKLRDTRVGSEYKDKQLFSRFGKHGKPYKDVMFTLTDKLNGMSWNWAPGSEGGEGKSLGHLIKTLRTTGVLNRVDDYSLSVDRVAPVATVAAVPVPAAVWLFGSGLIGLIAMARRRK
jgi:hypothetical protein